MNKTPDDSSLSAEKENVILSLSKMIISEGNDLDLVPLLSLLSLLFKEQFKTDELVQILEVNFLRANNYKISSFYDIISLLNDLENEDNKEITNIFKRLFAGINDIISNNDNLEAMQFIEKIKLIFKENADNINKYLSTNNAEQLTIPIEKKHKYTLTPTGGITILNKNPYEFFVSKVLHLKPIDEWINNIDAQAYGIFIHQIVQEYANQCKKLSFLPKYKINKNLYIEKYMPQYKDLFEQVVSNIVALQHFTLNPFIEKKIDNIKDIIIQLEIDSAVNHRFVIVEQPYSTNIDGVDIYAKADRIEIDYDNKEIYIFDFKTGTMPTNSDEINGTKTQLLVIAMLMLEMNKYKDFKIRQMRYINLSGKNNSTDTIISVDGLADIKSNIQQQIARYFTNGVPNENVLQYIKPSGRLYEMDYATMHLNREEFIK